MASARTRRRPQRWDAAQSAAAGQGGDLVFPGERPAPIAPYHFVPFVGSMRHHGSPRTFHRALQGVFLAAAASLFLNRAVRLACMVLGGVILFGTAASMPYYENNRTNTALVLILAGLQPTEDEPWLVQWQVILLYAAAAFKKLGLADWRNGRFIDSWIGYSHPGA